MEITRSTKLSLKFANKTKIETLKKVLEEYGHTVNFFINRFWNTTPSRAGLLKPVVDLPDTWLSYTLRQIAAREAISMITQCKKRHGDKAGQPQHRGKHIQVTSIMASLESTKNATNFDAWMHLTCLGNKLKLDLPVKFHQHYHKLAAVGKRAGSFTITKDYILTSFEIETGPKKETGPIFGIDTGINALASLSDGQQLGTDIKECVERIKRCEHGSNGQKTARRALKQRMDEVAKEVMNLEPRLIVVEDLKKLNHKTKLKRRLSKNMRRSLGSWTYSYWLDRLQQNSEWRRSAFRRVAPYYTSQQCFACDHTERGNRNGEKFLCLECGHTDNADINAARNILNRFLTGPYGAGFQVNPLMVGEL